MYRLGYLTYIAAAAEFFREHQTAGALLAIALLGWSLATDLLANRTTWTGPILDESGYGAAMGRRNVAYLSRLERFAFAARFVSVGLGLFGPLLFAWSLLL